MIECIYCYHAANVAVWRVSVGDRHFYAYSTGTLFLAVPSEAALLYTSFIGAWRDAMNAAEVAA